MADRIHAHADYRCNILLVLDQAQVALLAGMSILEPGLPKSKHRRGADLQSDC